MAPVWPWLKLPACVFVTVRSGTGSAATTVLALAQLVVVHDAPGAAGPFPPSGSTDAWLVAVPGDSAVAVIVNDAPFPVAATMPLPRVAEHVSNAPAAEGSVPQLIEDTLVPAATA